MKRPTLFFIPLALLLVAWLLWLRPAATAPLPSTASVSTPSSVGTSTQKLATPSATPAPTEVSHLADNLNAPTADIRADLRIVSDILATFRSNFPRDGNPVGNNAEITAALAGQNKLRFAFLPPTHSAINPQGELCDRWGTPFFFHAESGSKMEVRSAGPDKKLYTPDDAVSSP